MGVPRILGMLLRFALLTAVVHTHYFDEAQAGVVPTPSNNICFVEQPVNVTLQGLCLNVPTLCPKDMHSKFSKILVEVEPTIVEKCCPGFVRSLDKLTCVEIEEIPTTEESSDVWQKENLLGRSGLMMSKFVRALRGEFEYNGPEFNQEDLEYVPYEKVGPKYNDQEQKESVPSDLSQGGDLATNAKAKENDDAGATSNAKHIIYAKLALFAGGLLSVIMILFNVFLVVLTYKAYHSRYADEEIIEELDEIAKKSTKQVEWIDMQTKDKSQSNTNGRNSSNTNTISGLYRSSKPSEGDHIAPKKKIMVVMKAIQRVLLDVLIRCKIAQGSKSTKSVPDTFRASNSGKCMFDEIFTNERSIFLAAAEDIPPPYSAPGETFSFSVDISNPDINEALVDSDIESTECFEVEIDENANEYYTDETELAFNDDLFIRNLGCDSEKTMLDRDDIDDFNGDEMDDELAVTVLEIKRGGAYL